MQPLGNRWTQMRRFGGRKTLLLAGLGIGALGLLFSACSGAKTYEVRYYPASSQAASAPSSTTVYLSIVTPDQTGKEGYPAYVPANFTVPAHSKVTFVISNFDDATPVQSPQFAKVMGTVGGTMTVQPINDDDPNNLGKATTVSQIDPNDVSHTFTVPMLGNLNVPVPANSRVTFTVQTGAGGSIIWTCADPCGSGPNGYGGAMETRGYMSGTITVA